MNVCHRDFLFLALSSFFQEFSYKGFSYEREILQETTSRRFCAICFHLFFYKDNQLASQYASRILIVRVLQQI